MKSHNSMQKVKRYFEGDDVNNIYLDLIKELSTNPEYVVKPRGMEVKETLGIVVKLNDASKNTITFKDRKLNYAFAVIEKLEYLTGQTDPDRLVFYNSNFDNYRSEYGIFDGAYPERLGYWYRHIYNLLKNDPDTRQAVMTIYGVQDRHKSKDIPCTVMFQFFIRNNKLNMIAYMRSNDLLWGFPYDTSGFCFVLEGLAACLDVEVGSYELHAGSFHMYTERDSQLTNLLNASEIINFELPKIPKYDSFDSLQDDLRAFWIAERSIRVKNQRSEIVESLPDWLKAYYYVIEEYINKKYNKQLL